MRHPSPPRFHISLLAFIQAGALCGFAKTLTAPLESLRACCMTGMMFDRSPFGDPVRGRVTSKASAAVGRYEYQGRGTGVKSEGPMISRTQLTPIPELGSNSWRIRASRWPASFGTWLIRYADVSVSANPNPLTAWNRCEVSIVIA